MCERERERVILGGCGVQRCWPRTYAMMVLERKFIDDKTSIIKGEDPLRGLLFY